MKQREVLLFPINRNCSILLEIVCSGTLLCYAVTKWSVNTFLLYHCVCNESLFFSISTAACINAIAAAPLLVAVACGRDEGLKGRTTYRITLALSCVHKVIIKFVFCQCQFHREMNSCHNLGMGHLIISAAEYTQFSSNVFSFLCNVRII